MKKVVLSFVLLILVKSLIAQVYWPTSNGEVVEHTYYAFSYSEKHEQAEWVYYELSPEMLTGTTRRKNNFRADPKVSSGSAQLVDYENSGYDRGHLVPAGDMTLNAVAMRECFYLSNISPQSPSFNRGIWKALESLVRKWAREQKVYVVTGGILTDGLKEIGVNGVDVPKHFYKIVYAPQSGRIIAFILPNEKGERALNRYAVEVNEVEELTHIDFFPQLPDAIEEALESGVNIEGWDFKTDKTAIYQKKGVTVSSSQCKGITKSKGTRCKNKTDKTNGYCYAHQGQSPNQVN